MVSLFILIVVTSSNCSVCLPLGQASDAVCMLMLGRYCCQLQLVSVWSGRVQMGRLLIKHATFVFVTNYCAIFMLFYVEETVLHYPKVMSCC